MPYWDSLHNSLKVLPFMNAVISNSYLESCCYSTMSFLFFVYIIGKLTDDTDNCKLYHITSMNVLIQSIKG